MENKIRVLAINPGSTSTKIALFDENDEVFSHTIHHAPPELINFKEIQDQLGYRRDTVEKTMAEKGFSMADVDVFVGARRGFCPSRRHLRGHAAAR